MIARSLATLFALAAMASAQNLTLPTSFSTTPFNVPNTFTPTTTFASATQVSPTTLTGVGPSIAPGPASFSYEIPASTVPGVVPSAVYSSLAAAGLPTNAQGGLAPAADPNRIFANQNAASARQGNAASAMLLAAVAGAGAVLLA